MTINFDPSIALGSMIHMVVLTLVIYFGYSGMIKHLTRIESKQDSILDGMHYKAKS